MTITFLPSRILEVAQPVLHDRLYFVWGWMLLNSYALCVYDSREDALYRSLSSARLPIDDPLLLEFLHNFTAQQQHESLLYEVVIEGRLSCLQPPVQLQDCSYLRWTHEHGQEYFSAEKSGEKIQWKKCVYDPYSREAHPRH